MRERMVHQLVLVKFDLDAPRLLKPKISRSEVSI